MKIGLIDNDMCTRKMHNFPNLALMKISAFYKSKGCDVSLIGFDHISEYDMFSEKYDKIFIAKVFTDTITPKFIDQFPNITKGGSGFYYDKAEPLSYEIEHMKPDYNLYKRMGKYYNNFSIGFITRGCIRKCSFCINRNYSKVDFCSNPSEFIEEKRPFIMLLDDNITAYKGFENVFNMLNETGKPFVFKQGMDFRLLTLKKMNTIWNSNYYSLGKNQERSAKAFYFAFDNIADYDLIQKNIKIWYTNRTFKFNTVFYVFCGFDRKDNYDSGFYVQDIESVLKRIELLFKYDCYPYIMLHENHKKSPLAYILKSLKKVCNNPMFITNKTMGEALKLSEQNKTIKYFTENHKWFLDIRYNSLLLKK